MTDRLRRLGVTFGIAGSWAFVSSTQFTLPGDDHVRVLALGLTPYFSASFLVALVGTVVARRRRDPRLGTRSTFQGWVDGVGLTLAVVQAALIMMGSEAPSALNLGLLVGGAILGRLAVEGITRFGLGSGWAVLFAADILWNTGLRTVVLGQDSPVLLGVGVLLGYGVVRALENEPVHPPALPLLPIGLGTVTLGSSLATGAALVTSGFSLPQPPDWLIIDSAAAAAALLAVAFHLPARVRVWAPDVALRPWVLGILRAGAIAGLSAWALKGRQLPASTVVQPLILIAVGMDLWREWGFRAEGDTVVIGVVERGYEVAPIAEALADAGIPALPTNALYRGLTPFGQLLAPVEIRVPAGDAVRAQEVFLARVTAAAAVRSTQATLPHVKVTRV